MMSAAAVAAFVLLFAPPESGKPPAPPVPATAPTASVGLSRAQADAAAKAALKAIQKSQRTDRAAELKAGIIPAAGMKMRIWAREFGRMAGDELRPLWISMHGGGGAPAPVNDAQWENQKRLYSPPEGVYVAPRAPTNEWNLWHQGHVDALFDRLIEDLVMCERVDPDRVYLMGYSAGGDGVYQLAPRMADRFAAAAMMAGHPNEAVPDGLRNLPFSIQVGALDAAFERNTVAASWGERLAALQRADPGGYVHDVQIRPGKGHWMDGQDASAIPWMARHVRDPRPRRIVWVQDDVVEQRFYWLAVDRAQAGQRVVCEREGQEIRILEAPAGLGVTVRLDDEMADLDEDVRITFAGAELFRGRAMRSKATIERVLKERFDPKSAFTAEVEVRIPESAAAPPVTTPR
ncbi:MAG: alpha/beta hydrolase [Phycisphaerales bacterium]|nr:alpha/beta hydrolase [Phycisphaerales bacterium]